MLGSAPRALTDGAGKAVAQVGTAGRLLQFQMAELAARTSRMLRGIEDDEWYGLLGRAAGTVLDGLQTEGSPADRRVGETAGIVAAMSATTGLPTGRIRHGLATVAVDLARMAEILSVQAPGGDLAAFRTGVIPGQRWRWKPAGRSVFVRVPANFPTIVIEWLQALAARRPVLLATTSEDPFTSYLFADALYRAGLPDGALSLCHWDASALVRLADQVLWPGPELPAGINHAALKTYHVGRSKAVVTRQVDDLVWTRLGHMAYHGCGRLCTNLSGLAVTADAQAAAERLAAELALPVLPLDDHRAVVPAFPHRVDRDALARAIEREIAAGAVDVTADVTGVPLRVDLDGVAFLRPTVLLVNTESPLWGTELPFPFVTVARVSRSRLSAACAKSLIVAMPDAEPELVEQLADEPTVDKVFARAVFDRGYDPSDPHEGYLADFLFRKKALLTGTEDVAPA
jgi:thienamycin biosynthesis protein ThnO